MIVATIERFTDIKSATVRFSSGTIFVKVWVDGGTEADFTEQALIERALSALRCEAKRILKGPITVEMPLFANWDDLS